MLVLAMIRRRIEKFTDEQFAPLMEPEAEEARRLYSEGLVRAIHSRKDVPGAVLELEAPSVEEAEKIVRRLPLVAAGMLEYTLIPCGPYRGFMPRA